jgi:RecG-like helicase
VDTNTFEMIVSVEDDRMLSAVVALVTHAAEYAGCHAGAAATFPLFDARAAHRDPAAAEARERLAYDEVFANQLALMLVRASSRRRKGVPLKGDGSLRDRLQLPYTPTSAQRGAVSAACAW